jgi:hypothetical protein
MSNQEKEACYASKGLVKPTIQRAAPASLAPPQEPPSPTASLSGDKYILVRAPLRRDTAQSVVKDLGTDVKEPALCTESVSLQNDHGLKSASQSSSGAAGMSRIKYSKTQEGITVRTVYSQSFGCDAGGKADVTSDITPWSNTTEWGALSTLYSEFRCKRVRLRICPYARWTRASAPFSTNMMAVGFTPTSSAIPGGVRQVLELTNSTLFVPRLVTAGATPAGDVYSFDTNGHERTLAFDLPKGPMVAGSGTVYTSDWTSTYAPIPPGAIKLYVQSSNVSEAICIVFIEVDMEFRQRGL